jgi:outer membrane lipoprotein SlyB
VNGLHQAHELYSQEISMRNFSRSLSVTSSVLLLAGLAACVAPPMSPSPEASPVSTYPARTYPAQNYPTQNYPAQNYPAQNQQGNYAEYGRVSNVEVIRTQEAGKGSGVGVVLGGLAGAVIGHQIGGGSGRDAATVVGAVGGAVAGNAIEKSRGGSVSERYRVSVQLDNGTIRAYDVPSFGELRIGDRIRIENGQLFRIM